MPVINPSKAMNDDVFLNEIEKMLLEEYKVSDLDSILAIQEKLLSEDGMNDTTGHN